MFVRFPSPRICILSQLYHLSVSCKDKMLKSYLIVLLNKWEIKVSPIIGLMHRGCMQWWCFNTVAMYTCVQWSSTMHAVRVLCAQYGDHWSDLRMYLWYSSHCSKVLSVKIWRSTVPLSVLTRANESCIVYHYR